MAEVVRGTLMSMGLTGARVDACMDHLKGVQGPRKGSEVPALLSLCPWERHHMTRTGSHQSRDLPLLHARFSWFL